VRCLSPLKVNDEAGPPPPYEWVPESLTKGSFSPLQDPPPQDADRSRLGLILPEINNTSSFFQRSATFLGQMFVVFFFSPALRTPFPQEWSLPPLPHVNLSFFLLVREMLKGGARSALKLLRHGFVSPPARIFPQIDPFLFFPSGPKITLLLEDVEIDGDSSAYFLPSHSSPTLFLFPFSKARNSSS